MAGTIFEDIENDEFPNIMRFAAQVFVAGLLGPQHGVQVGTGGGGSQSDMPWRDKDEDIKDFALRCLIHGRKLYKASRRRYRMGKH
mgnify:FL=1